MYLYISSHVDLVTPVCYLSKVYFYGDSTIVYGYGSVSGLACSALWTACDT